MAGNYHFSSTSDADLAKELLAGSCELYIQRHEYEGTAVFTAGGTSDTLKLNDEGACVDDAYNSSAADNLYIEDDNGALARGRVIDTTNETNGCVINFQLDDMVLVSDGVTIPTLTTGNTYNVLILSGSNVNEFGDFFGYVNDSVEFDSTIETEPLVINNISGQEEEVAEKVNRRSCNLTGATYNVPNSDIMKNVMNMQQYGLNDATHREFHGGFSPNINTFYQITGKTQDWDGNNLAVQLFKGQLYNNGAWPLTGGGWKTISFQYKGKRDLLRDSNRVNGFRILIYG